MSQKRSRHVTLTLGAASAIALLSGCEAPPSNHYAQDTAEMKRLRAENADLKRRAALKESAFSNVEECVATGKYDAESCEAGFEIAKQQAAAQAASGQQFNDPNSCNTQYGNCFQHTRSNGSSVWLPLIGGYMLGSMLSDSGRTTYQPVYVDRHGSRWLDRDGRGHGLTYIPPTYQGSYDSGSVQKYNKKFPGQPQPKVNAPPPKPKPKAVNTKAVSKGGFGGKATKYGGSWGG